MTIRNTSVSEGYLIYYHAHSFTTHYAHTGNEATGDQGNGNHLNVDTLWQWPKQTQTHATMNNATMQDATFNKSTNKGDEWEDTKQQL